MVVVLSIASGCALERRKDNQTVDIAPMEIEEVNVYSFDYIGGQDVMPIIGYYGPCPYMYSYDGNNQPSGVTDEYYQMIAESGINILSYPQNDYKTQPENVMKMLDLAHKYGIGQAVVDYNIAMNYEITREEAVDFMKDYINHPAYVGNFVWDEPGNTQFDSYRVNLSQLSNLSKVLNEEIGVWSYLNLLPADPEETEPQVYVDYLKEFCETQSPNVLLYDHYPDFDPESISDQAAYIWNLAIVRQTAEEYKLPWWGYIGAGGQWNDEQVQKESVDYYPDEGQFDWNVNTTLAFGAKGINYFAVSQPTHFAYGAEEGTYDFQRNCMIGAYGNKNEWYYYAQNANKHIVAVDEILMNAVSKGVIVTAESEDLKKDFRYLNEEHLIDTSAIIQGKAWRELTDVSGEALIGCFNFQGKTALYVVNYSYDYAQKIGLSFAKECNIKVIQDAATTYVKGDNLILDMSAGDGALIVFE